jgi:hypothetical protein
MKILFLFFAFVVLYSVVLGQCTDEENRESCRAGNFCGMIDVCDGDGVTELYDCGQCVQGYDCVSNSCCVSECTTGRCGTFTLCGQEVECGCGTLEICDIDASQCVGVECITNEDCGDNEVCNGDNVCECDVNFVLTEVGVCDVDPCTNCTDINAVCTTGVECYCRLGYEFSNGECVQSTDPDGDQTTDLHFRQTLPINSVTEVVPLNFEENRDGSLTLFDTENRPHMLQWIESEQFTGGSYDAQVTVNAPAGSTFAFMADVGQGDFDNDGYGVKFANIGTGATVQVCQVFQGLELCNAAVNYPTFPSDSDVVVSMNVVRNGGTLISVRANAGPVMRSVFDAGEFDEGVVGFFFENTNRQITISQASVIIGQEEPLVDLYSCLSDIQYGDLFTELTGFDITLPQRNEFFNGQCNVAEDEPL